MNNAQVNEAPEEECDQIAILWRLAPGEQAIRPNRGPGHFVLIKVPAHLQPPREEPGDSAAMRARRAAYAALMSNGGGAIFGCPRLVAGRNLVPADYWVLCEENAGVQIAMRAGRLIVLGVAKESELTAQEESMARRGLEELQRQMDALTSQLSPEVRARLLPERAKSSSSRSTELEEQKL